MEEYNDPIRDKVEEVILNELEGAKKLEVGSTERKTSIDCAATLLKEYHEDCRLGGQLLKDQEEIELAKKRFREESDRAERRTELDEEAAERATKWYNHPLARDAMICATSIGTLGLCMAINSGTAPLRQTLEKYIFLIKPKL